MTKTLKRKMRYRVLRSKSNVFTPKDFLDLSGRDQIGRGLRELVGDALLIKFGRGLYAKAKRSSITNAIIPVKPLPEIAREALVEKLNIQVVPTEALKQYNSGQSTQVPTGRVIAVRGRVSRKMSYGGKSVSYLYVS